MKIQKNRFKFIYLEITNHCNLSCPFCPSSILKRNNYLDLLDFEENIKKISIFTDTVYLHILGEPLLHPNFIDIINLLNKYNLKVRITTNGTLINKYDFSKLSINKISFSLQSLIQFNDDGILNYFKNIIVFLNSVKEKLDNKELGIDFRIWNDKQNQNIDSFNKKLEYYLKEIVKIDDISNARISYDDEFTWPDEEDSINNIKMKCLGGKTHLGVLVNGDVVLCCLDYLGKTKIGNLNQNSLEEILSGDLYQNAMIKMLGGTPYFKLCESCKYRNKFN